MRTELDRRMIGMGTNALASSIVLVCRRRPIDAPPVTRREFLTALRTELPQAVHLLQTGNVAPVDLAQAAIGPGMAVYTRYAPFIRRRCNAEDLMQRIFCLAVRQKDVSRGELEASGPQRWAKNRLN